MYNQSVNQSNTLQYKCFSSEALTVFGELRNSTTQKNSIESEVFSPLYLLAKAVTEIQSSYNLLHEMSNPKTAYKHESIQGKAALITILVVSVATTILFGSLSSSAAVGLSVGAISFFATVYFIKFTNNYIIERECIRIKQEIEIQDKSIQSSMFSTEKFCSNYGKFLASNCDNVIQSVQKQLNGFFCQHEGVASYKKAFQEAETLCAFYKVATK